MSFLVGQPFKVKQVIIRELKKQEFCMTAFDCGETSHVEVTLSFNKKSYSPYLLPVRLADSSGDRYSDEDVQKILSSSSEFGRSITKQLRPTIQSRSLDHFKSLIPQLKSIKANVYLIRRGNLASWKIDFFTFDDAVFWTKGGEMQF
jgi:hypothetical protein